MTKRSAVAAFRMEPGVGLSRLDPVWPGLDSEFYLVERKLAELGLPRRTTETRSTWLRRIGESALAGTSELPPMLAWHHRLRFDPNGLTAAEREALRKAVSRWLSQPRNETIL